MATSSILNYAEMIINILLFVYFVIWFQSFTFSFILAYMIIIIIIPMTGASSKNNVNGLVGCVESSFIKGT